MSGPPTGIGTGNNPSTGIGVEIGGTLQDGAVITDGEIVRLSKEDDTTELAKVIANVDGDALLNVALPGNKAVLTQSQADVVVEQANGDNGGPLTVNVSANNAVLRLANATQRILTDQAFVQVKLNGGSGAGVTSKVNIAAGVLTDIRLATFYGLVNNGLAMAVPVVGVYISQITPQVDSGGNITGFTLS